MDFLKQLALPQSHEHILVLHFVLNLLNVLFMPFLSLLLGLTFFSLLYDYKGRKQSQNLYLQFAKESIGTLISHRNILILLGIVPYLAIVFSYAQLLQGSNANSVTIMTWGFFAFCLGIFLIYSYRSNLVVNTLLANAQTSEEVDSYRKETLIVHWSSGKWGFFFTLIGVYFLLAGISEAGNPEYWDGTSTINVLFTGKAFLKFIEFVVISFATSSIAVLFFTFVWEGGKKNISQEYAAFVKSKMLPVALVSLLLVPVFFILKIIFIPKSGLTGILFFASFLALLFVFFASHAVYGMVKEFKVKYASNAFYLLMCVFFFTALADQSAISGATQEQSALLAYRYTKFHEDLLSRMGISLKVVSGEDIYTAKCSACHLYDKVKVGPAYKDVLPKYESDRAQLVSFILNPHKINPAFPTMPNQGLKPVEADSIAAYIMVMYKK